MKQTHDRERATALTLLLVLLIAAIVAPSFYSPRNLIALLVDNAATLIVAIGMTLIILTGHIDISVGSQFAVATVVTGLLAKSGMPAIAAALGGMLAGALMGAINGILVARLHIPSIVVTLATMVALRDSLRWAAQGRWIQDLPPRFQWAGLSQANGELLILGITAACFAAFAWVLANVPAGRILYATGSNVEAARLAGIRPPQVFFRVFACMGLLTGLAASLNAIRFSEVQSSSGVGLELKAIAAVVVGGASITGGRATLVGTLLGVALLGVIGPTLTFAGINAFWEKAIEGIIILAAVAVDSRRGNAARV